MTKKLLPGDYVCDSEGYIRGHGTIFTRDTITSTYLGKMVQINKLITVSPFYPFKYSPEIGDVILGRISSINNKKWIIDANCRGETTLSLSAINLPGVMQRRKSEDDEMNMRLFFDIDDLIVCEVQKVNKNGNSSLHTRNEKYRRLENGILISIPSHLLVSIKSRFIRKSDIEIIIGSNGFIWLSPIISSPESYKKTCILYKNFKELCYNLSKINVEKIIEKILT